MQAEMKERTAQPDANDEELIDTLIAISVVAKRLARNLREKSETKGGDDGQDE